MHSKSKFPNTLYSYLHPVSGRRIEFGSPNRDIRWAVWCDGVMFHHGSLEAARAQRIQFQEVGRQTYLVPVVQED